MRVLYVLLSFCILLSACQSVRSPVFSMTNTQLQALQVRTRVFQTSKKMALAASIDTLQDMGYTLGETSDTLGVIVASKDEKQSSPGVDLAFGLAFSVLGDRSNDIVVARTTYIQKRIMVHVQPLPASQVRVSLTLQQTERLVIKYLSERQDVHMTYKTIDDAQVYQAFFGNLDKALFLGENQVG